MITFFNVIMLSKLIDSGDILFDFFTYVPLRCAIDKTDKSLMTVSVYSSQS